ncbi:hypothetical protein [Roseateles violae]|uniref:Uncharacterized protein n=1 Tax=Roseateles violae TaxID=3058042 RepID=A0ABT8DW92_9BURK|nr:hypothetical protein [Pelomonas sp. PFR6]MDN3920657.1 hypothetical protein [Pelomonas sp. PFR6]
MFFIAISFFDRRLGRDAELDQRLPAAVHTGQQTANAAGAGVAAGGQAADAAACRIQQGRARGAIAAAALARDHQAAVLRGAAVADEAGAHDDAQMGAHQQFGLEVLAPDQFGGAPEFAQFGAGVGLAHALVFKFFLHAQMLGSARWWPLSGPAAALRRTAPLALPECPDGMPSYAGSLGAPIQAPRADP